MADEKLAIIGRDRFLVDKLAKQMHATARRHCNYGPMCETARGVTFEAALLAGGLPTGHVVRVTVELDRLEPGTGPATKGGEDGEGAERDA